MIRTSKICKRFTSFPLETITIPLPEDCVRDTAEFEVTDINLCGPLFFKEDRKSRTALFTCAIYRAMHLKLALSLATDCYLTISYLIIFIY